MSARDRVLRQQVREDAQTCACDLQLTGMRHYCGTEDDAGVETALAPIRRENARSAVISAARDVRYKTKALRKALAYLDKVQGK